MMALGVIRAAAEADLTVPGDLSVVGFDDIQLAQHVHPPLTTLAQDKTGLGVQAANALLRQIEGADTAQPVTLAVELIVRGSTAAAAGR
jgi:LacI family transcriptional regulator